VDKAEDPEKMIKQVILDMENQLLQVKTQVAISIADQHVLEKKLAETAESEKQWMHRAELALDKKDDTLARAALERAMSYRNMAAGFAQQVEDQKLQVESLKTALLKLQQKLAEARAKSDMLIAQHRRARAMNKATEAGHPINGDTAAAAFERMKNKVDHTESTAQATAELVGDDVEERFVALEKQDEVERLLAGLKAKRSER
jgi:phage shock protein A